MDELDVFGGFVHTGALLPLWSLRHSCASLVGMPDDTPVLTCTVREPVAHSLLEASEFCNITFGSFEYYSSTFIRLRCRDVEIFWLVDYADPEVWEAAYKWTRVGRVPIKFDLFDSQQRQSMFVSVEAPAGAHVFSDYRYLQGEEPTAFMWDGMVALAENGSLESEELSVLPTVPFRASFTNILITHRWISYLNERCVDATACQLEMR